MTLTVICDRNWGLAVYPVKRLIWPGKKRSNTRIRRKWFTISLSNPCDNNVDGNEHRTNWIDDDGALIDGISIGVTTYKSINAISVILINKNKLY
jgi:hypothetical protein